MSINSSTNKVIALGDGATTQFVFNFVGDQPGYISVIFTDASGNETTLTQGTRPTQYRLTLNKPVVPGLWGIGGTVTYAPNGLPIPAGTTLTIFRTLPYLQNTTLATLSGSILAASAEVGLDQLEMQIQQIAEAQSRIISAPIVDPDTIDLTLPSAAQRANKILAFDGSGDVIAGTTPATGIISSAMQPVVNAASLATGRTAFGLGSVATLSPNLGLQENVSAAGNLDANFAVAEDASNQTVTAVFHLTQRFATGLLTYTLPASATLWSGFGFWINALTTGLVFSPNAADNFPGLASGQSLAIPAGSSGFLTTNGAGTWWIAGLQRIGFNSALNLRITASVSTNALTVAIKDFNGADPSPVSPVIIAFRDPTIANGEPLILAIASALSITVPAGATLATANGVPFKLWLGVFYNNGTPVLGLYQSVTGGGSPSQVTPWDETAAQSPTGISSGSGSAATWYAASGLSNVPVRILGFLEFANGQSTAGQWASSSTKIQLFGPGVKRPGEPACTVTVLCNSGTGTSGGAAVQTNLVASISLASKAHLVTISYLQQMAVTTSSTGFLALRRGSIAIGQIQEMDGANVACALGGYALDSPNSPSATYATFVGLQSGSSVTASNGSMMLQEIVT